MIEVYCSCRICWCGSRASTNFAPLPEKIIHLPPISELNTQMSVLINKAAANISTPLPHLQFLLIPDFCDVVNCAHWKLITIYLGMLPSISQPYFLQAPIALCLSNRYSLSANVTTKKLNSFHLLVLVKALKG